MVDYFGVDELLNARQILPNKLPQPKKIAKLEAFFHDKLAVALEDAVDALAKGKRGLNLQADEEMSRWRHLQTRAKAYLGKTRNRDVSSRTERISVEETISPSTAALQHSQVRLLPKGSDAELHFLQERSAQQNVRVKPIISS
jgi:hypothetical protein